MVWLIDERRLVLFPAGTIVRDSNYREFPSHRKSRIWTYAESDYSDEIACSSDPPHYGV